MKKVAKKSLVSRGRREDDMTVFQRLTNGSNRFFKPGELIREVGSCETAMAFGGFYNSLNTVQAIWMNSTHPFDLKNLQKAIEIVAKQTPYLQFCMARKRLGLWFKRMDTFSIDFEASTNDVMDVFKEQVSTPYSMWTGPLWRIRLVTSNADERSDKEKYSAALILSCQHAITDGTSNMKIFRDIISILNRLDRGIHVDIKPTAIGPIIDDTFNGIFFSFFVNHFVKRVVNVAIKNYSYHTSFHGILPVPTRKDFDCKIIYDELTTIETKNLIKMCKHENITVHSMMVAAANLALIEIAEILSKKRLEQCDITVQHCVNMRRYFNEVLKEVPGCHLSLFEDVYNINYSDRTEFWTFAQKIHAKIQKTLYEENFPVKAVPLIRVMAALFPINTFLIKNGMKNKVDCNFIANNMGNLKNILPIKQDDGPIEITYLLRSVSAHLSGAPFQLMYHTFRDQLMISMDYYINKITEETAQDFFKTLVKNLRALAAQKY